MKKGRAIMSRETYTQNTAYKTHWTEIRVLKDQDGQVMQIVGDVQTAQEMLRPEFLKLFNASVLLGKRRKGVTLDEAKFRILKSIESYCEKTHESCINMTALTSRAHRVTRNSAALREVLNIMQNEGTIKIFYKPGSTATFIKICETEEPKMSITDEEWFEIQRKKRLMESAGMPKQESTHKLKSAWDILEGIRPKPKQPKQQEEFDLSDGTRIVVSDDEQSEQSEQQEASSEASEEASKP